MGKVWGGREVWKEGEVRRRGRGTPVWEGGLKKISLKYTALA